MGQAREVENRLTEAINSGDLDAIEACYAEDARSIDPFGVHEGRDAVMRTWREFFIAFPGGQGRVDAEYEFADTAADEWVFTGTHSGPLATPDGGAIPATGKNLTLRGADFARVQDDRIVEHRIYFDQMELMTQLGLAPG